MEIIEFNYGMKDSKSLNVELEFSNFKRVKYKMEKWGKRKNIRISGKYYLNTQTRN